MRKLGIYASIEISSGGIYGQYKEDVVDRIFNWYEANFDPINAECALSLDNHIETLNLSGMDSKVLMGPVNRRTLTLDFYTENAYNLFRLTFSKEELTTYPATIRWQTRC
jgi:hypothetical protein